SFFFSSRRRHTRSYGDWSSDVCSSDLSEHHLKSGAELRPLFKGHAEALATPWEIAQECDLDLDFRKVRFPGYPVPVGETPFSFRSEERRVGKECRARGAPARNTRITED